MNPAQDAIKSSEVFPQSHIFYRNDRKSAGGGVFVGVSRNTTSDNKPELSTKCEIIWTKIKLKGEKDLSCGSFYMPHRHNYGA